MYTENDLYWLWLCLQKEITSRDRKNLRFVFGTASNIWEASERELVCAGLQEKKAALLQQRKKRSELEHRLIAWEKEDILFLSRENPCFPIQREALTQVDPPVDYLFARGDPQLLLQKGAALVGARRCSDYGARASSYVGGALARAGITVISGMACGIDACAHQGALSAGGNTIAVLGSGVDRPYPAVNRTLYEKIVRRGLVVSEFFPGEEPKPYHFPLRNRIIAALSDAVAVIEAGLKSGSLITADRALELSLPVFAVPGSIFEQSAEGSNLLIEQGAFPLLDCKELIRSVGGEFVSEDQKKFEDQRLQRVWNCLSRAPQPIEMLVSQLNTDVSEVLQCLTLLELDGLIVRNAEGMIMRV